MGEAPGQRVRRTFLVAACLAAAAAPKLAPQVPPAVAQQPTPVVPQHARAPDSGRVLIEQMLGGDSSQATTADLRRGAFYRVDAQPSRADISLRLRVRNGTTAPAPLERINLPLDTIPEWRSWVVAVREGGTHVIELTNPGLGATRVRVSALFRARSDTLFLDERDRVIWSEIVGGGPSFVTLDSGIVYQVESRTDVSISPRMMSGAPVRQLGGFTHNPIFTVPLPGEYRIEVARGASAPVKIWVFDEDQSIYHCFRSANDPGCYSHRSLSSRAVLVGILAIPVFVVLGLIFK
jgi:hypothetical protein